MSNLGQFNNKNSVWGKQPNMVNQTNTMQPPLMNQGALGNLNTSGMVPFQQQQVFQNAMGLQQPNLSLGLQQMASNQMNAASLSSQIASNTLFQHVGAVSYPNPRALNPSAFQTQAMNVSTVQNNSNAGSKQRVFTGTVTQLHDNFGFIDDEVFFPRNSCVKGSNPLVGDRVLVEASFNSSMPFKWNASRVQVLQDNSNNNDRFGRNRPKASVGGRARERSRERDREEEEVERKRRREERIREREKEERKSPIRRRSRSPKARRRPRIVPRYMVQIPKISLDLPEADVLEVKRRYSNLYIPSDFFSTSIRWVDAFPPHKQFMLNKPCSFHVMNKEIDAVSDNDAVLEPPDVDYSFSAKVMLMSVLPIEELYQKCCAMAEDKDRRDRDSEDRDFVHPSRLINFLVGLRGKNETMAIGGPWSPSLDGENPQRDPSVLIRTAIRTCKALTGIDLSNCTQWYRFVELYYRRNEGAHKGRPVPARVETVVVFLPDVWSCLPTRLEWDGLGQAYRTRLERTLDDAGADVKDEDVENTEPTHYAVLDLKTMNVSSLKLELKARNLSFKGIKSQLVARLAKALKTEAEEDGKADGGKEKNVVTDDEEMEVVQEEKGSEPETKKLDEKEKAVLEKRYTLPEQPHLIVHPSRVAKSGKFDCTVMSLSLLLDYRPEDTKEHSFEVSLFAELFNEMLMRDFGFNIVKALYELPDKPKEKEEDKKKKEDKKNKDKKEDDKDKKSEERETKKEDSSERKKETARKDDAKSDDSANDDDLEDGDDKKDRKDKDKKKKDRVKLYTKDKHLLLSFVYFDQTHCGYIFDKDMEELIYTLGLRLSRAQVKKLVSKVITRDSLHYRKLTDKPKDEENTENGVTKKCNLDEVASGNKKLLPVFQSNSPDVRKLEANSNSGIVTYNGAIIDIGKLLSQLERNETARLETESRLNDLKNENTKLSEKYAKSSSNIKHMHSELKEIKDRLRNTEDSLGRANAHSKLFQTTLMDIRDKIDPVLKTVSHKEEAKREREKDRESKESEKDKKDDNKSRWEKDGAKQNSADKEIKKEEPEAEVKKEDS